MPALALFLGGIFQALVAFFAQYVTRKIAFNLAAVTLLLGMTSTLYSVLSASMNGLVAVLPGWPGMETAIWLAVPPILPVAMAACIGADGLILVFQWNREQLRMLMT